MITLIVPAKKRPEKDVQNIIIQAVDCNQLLVLPSISSVGNLANDPLGEERQREKRFKLLSRLYAPSELLIHSDGNSVRDLDPTEGQVFENP